MELDPLMDQLCKVTVNRFVESMGNITSRNTILQNTGVVHGANSAIGMAAFQRNP